MQSRTESGPCIIEKSDGSASSLVCCLNFSLGELEFLLLPYALKDLAELIDHQRTLNDDC